MGKFGNLKDAEAQAAASEASKDTANQTMSAESMNALEEAKAKLLGEQQEVRKAEAVDTIAATQSGVAGTGDSAEHTDKVEQNDTLAQINTDLPANQPNDKTVQGVHNDRVSAESNVDGKAGQQETMQISNADTVNDANQKEALGLLSQDENRDPAPFVEDTDVSVNTGKFYSCLPTKNWQIGRFKFSDGQLHLSDSADIEEFEKILNHPKFPISERTKIKTIDFDLANDIARSQGAVAQRGYDSGQNAQFEQLKAQNPKVGTTDMGTKESGQKA